MLFTLLPLLQKYILGFMDAENYYEVLHRQIQDIMPGNAGTRLFDFIQDITTNPRIGLLSFGFILSLFFSSNGMMTLMHSFDKSYLDTTFKYRSGIKKRGIAILLTLQLAILLIASIVLIILGNYLIGIICRLYPFGFYFKIQPLFYPMAGNSIAFLYRYFYYLSLRCKYVSKI